MAGDRKVVHGERTYTAVKIEVIGDSIVGAAGDCAACAKWMAWYKAGQPTEGAPEFGEDDLEVLVLNRRGIFLYTQACAPDQLKDKCYAVGSGSQAALALMKRAKYSPYTAVMAVDGIDSATGLGCDLLHVCDIPKRKAAA